MYRLLVIDDEEIITDGLANMLERDAPYELDVYKAYTVPQAVALLEKAAFELVITDIHMPGVSGLTLLKKIHEEWPDCQVIVFSGYDEFEYAAEALRYHAARYVLKAEGYDALLDALAAAVGELEKAARSTELLRRAEAEVRRYQPLLLLARQSFLRMLLSGETPPGTALEAQFPRLGIALNPREPVMLLGAKAASLPGGGPPGEETLASVGALLREKTGMAAVIETGWTGADTCVFLLQSRGNAAKTRAVIKGRAEFLQLLCENLLKTRVSFLFDSRPMTWEELPPRYAELRFLLRHRIDCATGLALADLDFFASPAGGGGAPGSGPLGRRIVLSQERFEKLQAAMGENNRVKLRELVEAAARDAASGEPGRPVSFPEREFDAALNLTLLSYLTRRDLERFLSPDGRARLEAFLSGDGPGAPRGPVARAEAFLELADLLFALSSRERAASGSALADRVLAYIRANLGADLSLYALSEKVFLNPSYLSRRFKEITGRNLVDTVTAFRVDEAARLLRETSLRVNQIASQVGFDSPAYFSRLFKRKTGLTPADYREKR